MVAILGIDPGITTTGWAVIEFTGNKDECRLVSSGIISTKSSRKLHDKLKLVYEGIKRIMKNFHPDVVAIEQVFFAKNAKTALKVGEARGAIIVSLQEFKNIHILEYTPLQVKNILCGYGRADKYQIQNMVKITLNLKAIPKPDDVADAIAVALCALYSYKKV